LRRARPRPAHPRRRRGSQPRLRRPPGRPPTPMPPPLVRPLGTNLKSLMILDDANVKNLSVTSLIHELIMVMLYICCSAVFCCC
jgi:hypothetical protein